MLHVITSLTWDSQVLTELKFKTQSTWKCLTNIIVSGTTKYQTLTSSCLKQIKEIKNPWNFKFQTQMGKFTEGIFVLGWHPILRTSIYLWLHDCREIVNLKFPLLLFLCSCYHIHLQVSLARESFLQYV